MYRQKYSNIINKRNRMKLRPENFVLIMEENTFLMIVESLPRGSKGIETTVDDVQGKN